MSTGKPAQTSRRRKPRRRPAPRRNAGEPGHGRIKWDRVGRILFVCVVMALAVSTIKPAVNLARSYHQVSQTREQLHLTKQETDELKRRVKHLQGDAVLRREARRQGLVGAGESPVVVNGLGSGS